MEFLFFIIFGPAIVKSIMWVCEPMVEHVEAKEAREQKFMEKIEGFIDTQPKKGPGDVPAAVSDIQESLGDPGEIRERWPRRFTDGDMN